MSMARRLKNCSCGLLQLVMFSVLIGLLILAYRSHFGGSINCFPGMRDARNNRVEMLLLEGSPHACRSIVCVAGNSGQTKLVVPFVIIFDRPQFFSASDSKISLSWSNMYHAATALCEMNLTSPEFDMSVSFSRFEELDVLTREVVNYNNPMELMPDELLKEEWQFCVYWQYRNSPITGSRCLDVADSTIVVFVRSEVDSQFYGERVSVFPTEFSFEENSETVINSRMSLQQQSATIFKWVEEIRDELKSKE